MKNEKLQIKNLLIISFLVFLFLIPNFVQADLVPCGGSGEPPCEICHLFVMLDTIIDFVLFYIIFPLATLLLIIGGGMFVLSAGNPQKINNAKSILFSTIFGLVIIFSSWMLVNTFMTGIGLADWAGGGGGWYRINCPV
jgi:hypothetical protein